MNYEDIVFLKRAVREVLLARDPNNIQILKCFSLENTLQGLCLLLKKVLQVDKAKINKSDRGFTITTKVLDQKSGEFID